MIRGEVLYNPPFFLFYEICQNASLGRVGMNGSPKRSGGNNLHVFKKPRLERRGASLLLLCNGSSSWVQSCQTLEA